jgi:hypothetical protein
MCVPACKRLSAACMYVQQRTRLLHSPFHRPYHPFCPAPSLSFSAGAGGKPVKITATLFVNEKECSTNLTAATQQTFVNFLASKPSIDASSITVDVACAQLVGSMPLTLTCCHPGARASPGRLPIVALHFPQCQPAHLSAPPATCLSPSGPPPPVFAAAPDGGRA